jgi:hypothetical protein
MATESKAVVVRSFPSPIEAELAMGALQASGIDAAVRRGPGIQLAISFELLVYENDVEAASEVLGPEDGDTI